MESAGQGLAPYIEAPPEPPLPQRDEDELGEIRLDKLVTEKLRLLWRRRNVLKLCLGVGLVAGVAMAFIIPPRYESSVRLMPPENQAAMGLAGLSTMISGRPSDGLAFASTVLGMKSPGAIFVEVLRSRTVEDRMIDRFGLLKLYNCQYYEDARKVLERNSDISEDRKSGFIDIKVTDHNPSRARDMADAYVQELTRLVNQISTSSARQERIFLEERLKAEKLELDDASAKLAAFSSKNQMLNAPEQAKVAAAAAEMQAVQGVYAENSTRMRELRARMHELPQLGLQYAELYRRATIAEAVYEALTKQYEFAKVQEAKDVPAVRAVDAAQVPERKAGPPRKMVVLVALLLSFLMGSVWILGKDLWDNIDPSDERKLYLQGVAGGWARRLGLDRLTGGRNGSVPWRRGGPSLGNGA